MLTTGIKGNRERKITEDLTARAIGSGELAVFATPALIALAEETAWRSVADELEPGQGTVGTRMDLSHIAATPVGMQARCETELVEIDRRKLVFHIEVYDDVEKIAEGTHERFIVDNEKFQTKANGKQG
ncbi:MAG: thioesterase family protein [Eubacterium sp.]|nr:thioesterase family protein [Eubacterium sp.]